MRCTRPSSHRRTTPPSPAHLHASATSRARHFASSTTRPERTSTLTKGRQIIQSWRADDWDKNDPDSVIILNFEDDGSIEMVHAGVPDAQKAALADGWKQYYWKPLRAYLKR